MIYTLFQEDLARAEQLEATGKQLIEDEHYAVDCIRPKCIELQRMCEQYKEMVRARYDLLNRSRDLHDRIEKVSCSLCCLYNEDRIGKLLIALCV